MNKGIIIFLSIFLFSCSTQEDVPCEKGHGYLQKDGREFVCPFTLQKKTANGWIDFKDKVTILDSMVGDYAPLRMRNSPAMYKLKIEGLKEYFTEEQYTVSLRAFDKNRNPCGESREFTFYKVAENTDSVEYHSAVAVDRILYGQYLFFGLKEMPSYDWYHVLNVSCGGKISFILIGEIK